MRNFIRIVIFAMLAFMTGFAIYGLIYAPRFFKAGSIMMLGLTVYILYALVKQWIKPTSKPNNFQEAEIVEDEKNKKNKHGI